MINAITILSYIGLSQALFSAFLFYTKGEKKPHDRILIMWLLTIAIRFFLIATEQIHGQFFNAEFSIGLIPLTFGPFLFLYAQHLSNPSKRFSPYELLHFAPFLIIVSVYFIVFKDTFYIQAFTLSISIPTFFMITSVIYTGLVFWWLQRFRKSIRKDVFSYDSSSNRLFWLNYISVVYAVTYLIYFITRFYSVFAGTDPKELEVIPSIGLMILTYSISYFAIKQPNLFENERGLDTDEEISGNTQKTADAAAVKESKTPNIAVETDAERANELSPEKQHQIEKINRFMTEHKPYLKPELTLFDLSKSLNIPKHQITLLLNNCMGKNFFEYVNEFRIEETKKRMLDPQYDHMTLVAIAYECGFNSKSTFNIFFKNATGKTPTEWRKENKAKNDI